MPANLGRRRLLLMVGAAGAGLAVTAGARAADTMAEPSTDAADMIRTSLHQEWDLAAGAERVYATLLDAKAFAAFSGGAAEIDPKQGGAFSLFDKRIVGCNVELVPVRRIVQAWRSNSAWRPGVYSIAEFQFVAQANTTKVILDHTGFPQGTFASLNSGWHEHYEKRLQKYFS